MKAGLLAAVIFFLLLAPLSLIPDVGGSSEAREVHVAKIIFESDQWVLPLRVGIVPSKPMLFHWTVAALGEASGTLNESTARLVSLLASSLTLLITVWLASTLTRQAVPYAAASGARVGIITASILALSYEYLRLSLDARVDSFFSMFFVAAVAVIFRGAASHIAGEGDFSVNFSRRRLYVFFALCGLAVLAKGPLGIVLPFLTAFLLVSYVCEWRAARRLFLRPNFGWAIFLAIALPWYVVAAVKGSGEFVGRQILFENIQRFFGAEYVNSQPFWFYVPSFIASIAPWSLLFLLLAANEVRSLPANESSLAGVAGSSPARLRRLCLIWFASGFVFFSLASGKRDSYLLPLYPAAVIYLAWNIELWWLRLSSKGKAAAAFSFRLCSIALITVLVLTLGALELNRNSFVLSDPLSQQAISFLRGKLWLLQIWISVVVVISVLLYLFAAQLWHRAALTAFLCVATLAVSINMGLGIKADFKGLRVFARELKKYLPSGSRLTALRPRREESLDAVLYYAGGQQNMVEPPLETNSCSGYYLARRKYFEEATTLANESGSQVAVLAEFRGIVDELNQRNDRDLVLFTCEGAAAKNIAATPTG